MSGVKSTRLTVVIVQKATGKYGCSGVFPTVFYRLASTEVAKKKRPRLEKMKFDMANPRNTKEAHLQFALFRVLASSSVPLLS